MDGQLLMKIPDVQSALGNVGRSTVYALIAAGELPTVHIGRAVRVPVRAVREYVQRLEEEGKWA